LAKAFPISFQPFSKVPWTNPMIWGPLEHTIFSIIKEHSLHSVSLPEFCWLKGSKRRSMVRGTVVQMRPLTRGRWLPEPIFTAWRHLFARQALYHLSYSSSPRHLLGIPKTQGETTLYMMEFLMVKQDGALAILIWIWKRNVTSGFGQFLRIYTYKVHIFNHGNLLNPKLYTKLVSLIFLPLFHLFVLSYYGCARGILWYLQKCLQYIFVKFTPSIILLYSPTPTSYNSWNYYCFIVNITIF
jgi:hypothetical protein